MYNDTLNNMNNTETYEIISDLCMQVESRDYGYEIGQYAEIVSDFLFEFNLDAYYELDINPDTFESEYWDVVEQRNFHV